MHLSHCKFYRKSIESKSFLFALIVSCAALLLSCSTDFDVNAPYKEENAVYGLLELHDNQQIIKIGKVFQNSSSVTASQAAQQMDSLYQADSLQVSLTDNNTGAITALSKFYNTQKEPGIFASPGQYLYATPVSFVLDPAHKYTLTVYDPKTKVQSQGNTLVVNDIVSGRPNVGSLINISSITGYYSGNFQSGANAVTYSVNINIPIQEYSKKDSSLLKNDTLVYNILTNFPVSAVSSNIPYYFQNVDFYQFIGGSLKADPTVYRKMDSLDFEITGAAIDLSNYIQVNAPSQGVVQKNPTYTNITNGVGIFSSRLITHVKTPLSSGSYSLLETSTYTKQLNFVK